MKLSAMISRQQSDRKLIFDNEGIKAFATQLKKIRIREGLSQSQLAFESGLSYDMKITRKIKDSGTLMDIQLLDQLIIIPEGIIV